MIPDEIEVMAPAGSFESLQSAIKAGARSIYLGVGKLNMRARAASNFTIDELKEAVSICHRKNVKVYLTLNTIMYNEDMALARESVDAAKRLGVDAIIASDIGVITYANSIKLTVHISTQVNISNIESVEFYAQFADVVVLARELSLEQITAISQAINERDIRGPSGELVRIELFVHGALCMAISGKCYLSLGQYNSSANRGACNQTCRRKYKVKEEGSEHELVLDNEYIMSPKDLNTIGFLDQIIQAGVSILKLEGRGKPPEYVFAVTTCYTEAAQSIIDGTYCDSKVAKWNERLSSVYNRGFWQGGYYLGKKLGEWSGTPGSRATKKKVHVGKVTNYFSKQEVVEIHIEAAQIGVDDHLAIIGPTTGIVEYDVQELTLHGDKVTTPTPEKVRRGDKVYKMVKREVATSAS